MSSLARTRKALPITLALTLVVALLPASWMRWMESVADVVNIPLTAMRDVTGRLGGFLRPDEAIEAEVRDLSLEELAGDRDQWRQRYLAARMKIQELEGELALIKQLPAPPEGFTLRPVNARITGRNLKGSGQEVELNRGRREGIEPDTIAVYNGVHLVGRVSKSAPLRSVVVPITSTDSGLMLARVVPADATGEQPGELAEAPLIQVEPQGDGSFRADAGRDTGIEVGDAVILHDSENWPWSAQAMVLGRVNKVSPKDEQPLRDTLVIRPYYRLQRLTAVTLVVEVETDATAERLAREGGEATP